MKEKIGRELWESFFPFAWVKQTMTVILSDVRAARCASSLLIEIFFFWGPLFNKPRNYKAKKKQKNEMGAGEFW